MPAYIVDRVKGRRVELRGNVAFEFAEFLLESSQSRLYGLMLLRTRSEECAEETLIGNSGFLGSTLCCSKVCRGEMNSRSHLMLLLEGRTNCLRTSPVNFEMAKVWLFHDRTSESFSTPRVSNEGLA